MHDFCMEAILGHGYHWIKGVSCLTDGRDRNKVYLVSLQLDLYMGAVEVCVPSMVLPSV